MQAAQLLNNLAVPTILAAVLLDRLLGEPGRFHPLAGFGRLAQWIEKIFYGPAHVASGMRYVRGIAALSILLIPLVALAALLQQPPIFGTLFSIVVLYLAIAPRSLREHAERVARAFSAGDLPAARQAVSMMVSRDTSHLDEEGVARATVESVLENGNDAIFAALFWFVVAGAPGVVLYRLSNTLDAMWGYRNARYDHFGWAAARLDDVLNFIPARLTSLSYALVGHTRSALRCWRLQAAAWESPNAGPVMAAGAGALRVQLGGAAIYHGEISQRPPLGCGAEASQADITRAVQLVRHTLYVWLAVITLGALFIAGWQPYA
ncbi:cobalamin biosynthesis protein CbiB [mine drainage metagenome]|uniref:Cobalamin biosynthesis protein CbiB n=1 Tax=mine drainage metagenome TaxID=410659 RepID=A0A1J5SPV8_9ZZZZ